MSGMGNEVQARAIAEQVADAAVARFHQQHPQAARSSDRTDVPAPLKWAGAIVASLMAAGVAALCFWVVSTLSDLTQTVTRIDERQQLTGGTVSSRLDKIEERMIRLEHQQIGGGKS